MIETNKTVDPSARRDDDYTESITGLSPEAYELITKYSHVPEEEILPHVHALRDQAWKVCPYGCIGLFDFTSPAIQNHPVYIDVLPRMKKGEKLLDLGCGFGQNMRKLVLDGAPRETVFGADVSEELIGFGTEYFRDGDSPFMYFIGDILAREEDGPNPLDMATGQFDIIYTSKFYHLWNRETQLRASITTIKFLKPQPGSMIFGSQLGVSPAVEIQLNQEESRKEYASMFRHDEKSFRQMWDEVEKETGTQWRVEVQFKARASGGEGKKIQEPGSGGDREESQKGVVSFSITRL